MRRTRIPDDRQQDMQHLWTEVGHTAMGSEPLLHTVARRFASWGLSDFFPRVAPLQDQLRLCPPSWACAVMRTWTNGWLTSARMPGDVQRCICGCSDADDRQDHYYACPHFHIAVRRALAKHNEHGPWQLIPIVDLLGIQCTAGLPHLDRFRIPVFCSLFYSRCRYTGWDRADPRSVTRLMALGQPARGRPALGN